MKLAEIYEGWRNKLIPPKKMKEEIANVRAERLIICHHCAYNSRFHKTKRPDVHCTVCGCTLSAKTSCLSCSCPLTPPKWDAVVSREQEDVINNENNGK